MKVSKKDRWLLAAFLGILVFACSYLFVFQPAMEKADALEVENMQLQGRIMDLKNKEANQETYESEILRMEQEIEEIYQLFPVLRERKKQQGGTLSGGEQQMLALGRAMMSGPQLIMLDEPSMGLAPIVVKQVFKFIKKINESGITVLLIEQNARQAMGLSDYTYVLENGKVKMEGESQALMKDEGVQRAYLGVQ